MPFYLVETAPDLGTEKNDLDALIASVEGVGVAPRLIIIDTLAQTLNGGEENNTGMVNFVANATALAVHFKACILAVHHVPLADDKRLRGHTSLHGGADAQLLTERSERRSHDDDLAGKVERRGGRRRADRPPRPHRHRAGRRWRRCFDIGSQPHRKRQAEAAKGKAPKTIPQSRPLADGNDRAGDRRDWPRLRSFPDGPLVRAVHDEAVRLRYYARIAEQAAPDELPDQLAERQRKAFSRAVKDALDAKDIIARAENDRRFLWLP